MVAKEENYPRVTIPHIRIVAGGTYGPEIWTCSLKAASFQTETATQIFFSTLSGADNAQELNDLNTYLTGSSGGDGLAHYADNFAVPAWTALMAMLDARAKLTYVKVNAFGSDDHQINPITLTRQFAPVAGAVACTGAFTSGVNVEWRTSHKSHGKASHGSMHLPVSPVTDSAGQVSGLGLPSTFVPLSQVTPAVSAFITKLNGPSSTGRQLLPALIYTQLVGAPYASSTADRTPEANAIDEFFISTKPGITRRRGNKLKQGSSAAVFDYGAVA